MIIPHFVQFRDMFAVSVTWSGVATFAAAGRTLTVAPAPGFDALGFLAGMRCQVVGTASNDGWWTLQTVAAGVLTFVETPVNEVGIACSATARFEDRDGYATWPVANVRKVGSGFGDSGSTITGIPKPYAGTIGGFTVTCNAGAADAVPGTDEYDWYLSQRSDVPANQLLSTYAVTAGANTYSGSVRFWYDAIALRDAIGADVMGTSGVTPTAIAHLFARTYLYVKRRSDGAIQWVDLTRAQIANV